ncbi:uncharacterized protein LOC119383925 isoform X2 [Rhipicephalus sanguineus]|uniref:uncharacterized protein LOC119383925 isoform X2 n=1 Tax=Rhipicephalus sanguineus TaxID=34632 RepID=UPI001893B910|nr:uncharacterized protein LOC119383925 isoform X2 [Rhipicephalus sanguineus]
MPAAMELFDAASSPGRRGVQACGEPSIKELLQRVYSAHISATEGLQKQVLSLTALVSEKEKELRNVSCQRCASFKDTFERYKASNQQVIDKLETKIRLLEEKNATQEKELRGRNASPIVNGSSLRAAKNGMSSECRQQLLNGTVSPKPWDSILQEDSPRHTSCLVPPSPTSAESSFEYKEAPEAVGCMVAADDKGQDLPPPATVQTVPETLECELYDGCAYAEIATYQPLLSAVAEEDSKEDSTRSRGAVEPTQVPNEKRLNDCVKEEEMDAELTDSEASMLVIDEREDKLTDADSEGSPSLLQQDRVARPASPHGKWDIDEVPPSNAVSTVTPARPLSEMPCRRLQAAADDGDKSPSLLDTFAAPKSVSDPFASYAVKEVHPSSPPVSDVTACDVTVCDDVSLPKPVQPGGGKLSLLRKRCASPTEPDEVFMVQPTSRAKRKKQTKLSDRYFLSVNRSTVPATRSSSISVKKELSQTRVDDSLLSTQSKRIDLDETFVEPELLRDFKVPVTAKALGSTGPLQNGGAATEIKKDLDKAVEASHAEEASSSSQAQSSGSAISWASLSSTDVVSVAPPTVASGVGSRVPGSISFGCSNMYLGPVHLTGYAEVSLSSGDFEFIVPRLGGSRRSSITAALCGRRRIGSGYRHTTARSAKSSTGGWTYPKRSVRSCCASVPATGPTTLLRRRPKTSGSSTFRTRKCAEKGVTSTRRRSMYSVPRVCVRMDAGECVDLPDNAHPPKLLKIKKNVKTEVFSRVKYGHAVCIDECLVIRDCGCTID